MAEPTSVSFTAEDAKIIRKGAEHLRTNAGIGHNRPQLERYVERLLALEQEKRTLAADIRELKAQAKESGFSAKALTTIVKLRLETDKQRARRLKHEATLDEYRAALGMLEGTPLADAALEAAGVA